MTEGVIAKWHKKVGDFVDVGDLILEISTDKATVEHNALDPGWLRKIVVETGKSAAVNDLIAIMTEEQNAPFDDTIAPKSTTTPASQDTAPQNTTSSPSQQKNLDIAVFASPLAKKLAKEQGITLENIQGSGPRGRIMSRDLEKSEKSVETKEPQQSPSKNALIQTLSPMRQVIAKKLQASKSTIPHFYLSINIDARRLIVIREEMKASGLTITVNDFIVKASAIALMEHPTLRGSFQQETNQMTIDPHADISVAVSIDGGLITPIVRRAEEKSLAQISLEVKTLAQKAKSNTLKPDEFIGGSYTISNLGMFGISTFQAIINPPQVAILAVGAALDMPIIENGVCVPGKVMTCTLSCDHRVVDGSTAAMFLQQIQELLESPLIILGK